MPARFMQRFQHLRPDVLMLFFILSQAIRADFELKTNAFHREFYEGIGLSLRQPAAVANCRSDLFQIRSTSLQPDLEVEISNVICVEDEGCAKQNAEPTIGILFDCVLT